MNAIARSYRWRKSLRAWAASHPQREYIVDDSRESIYGGDRLMGGEAKTDGDIATRRAEEAGAIPQDYVQGWFDAIDAAKEKFADFLTGSMERDREVQEMLEGLKS